MNITVITVPVGAQLTTGSWDRIKDLQEAGAKFLVLEAWPLDDTESPIDTSGISVTEVKSDV